MNRTVKAPTAVLGALVLVLAACGSSSTKANNPGTTHNPSGTPIRIGFISSQTGALSSSYLNAQWGAEARVDAQNAAGGVDGHPIRLYEVDDASSPATNQTAAGTLVQNDGVFGVIEDSPVTFGASKYLNQKGVPVTGAAIDGPEWGQQPNSNMFSVDGDLTGPIQGVNYTYTNEGKFFKQVGVTKFAGLTYDLSSAQTALQDEFVTFQQVGIKKCYGNTTYGFGAVDFTAAALSIHSLGCNGAEFVGLLSNEIGLAGDLKASGFKGVIFNVTGYDQNLLNSPGSLAALASTSTVQSYASPTVDFGHPNAGTQTFLANLKKYTRFTGGIPNLNIVFGYMAADAMIDGLRLAGPNPTRAAFISKLRQVGSYNPAGMLASPLTFQHFGTAGMNASTSCSTFYQITSTGYVAYNGDKPICGNLIAVKS